jgi:hypothetical protein
VDKSVVDDHLLSHEIEERNSRVAFGAVAAQPDGTAKEVAVRAAALTDQTVTAPGHS